MMAYAALTQDKLNDLLERTSEIFVVNKPAYVWRVNSLGMGEHHGYIPCWYIVDRDGNVLDGGYQSGNNCRSGKANYARKKDAMAVAMGLKWGYANLDKLTAANEHASIVKGWEADCPLKKTYGLADEDPYDLYECGVTDAYRVSIGRTDSHRKVPAITDGRKYKVK
tara:strand:+ start:188191 stop:188691 length:501 start_codon:yes stop_codon:yes gene_type:complete